MITQKQIDEHNKECEQLKKSLKLKGDWNNEPNRLEWEHAGFSCLMVRNSQSLYWCGYVGVSPKHPCFKKFYDDVNVDVHGGLTYADSCHPPICHIPKQGEDETWWLGFDCAHLGDLSPISLIVREHNSSETYKTLSYVKEETNRLAEQLRALAQ